jgi:hypothetical protein
MLLETCELVQKSAADAASASECARYALSVARSIKEASDGPHVTSDTFTDVVAPPPMLLIPPSNVVDPTFTTVGGKAKGKGKGKG